MSSIWGDNIKISIFGESHGAAIGVTIDKLPSGKKVDIDAIDNFMKKRRPGESSLTTARKEGDKAEIISGIHNGYTTGSPLTAIIKNNDIRSSDYQSICNLARPSHADYAAFIKYNGFNDRHGGGHFSGRLTAPLVFAGAICLQILCEKGIDIAAHIKSIENIEDESFDEINITKQQLLGLAQKDFPVLDDQKADIMRQAVFQAHKDADSVGGIIECAVIGVPTGLGNPMFNGIENKISSIIFGIPAIKGIEFGKGFAVTKLRGSRANDEIYFDGSVKTYTNNNGGITGGLANGMPIVFRVAIKPTPSIARTQRTIDMKSLKSSTLEIKGRHDPCIVLRCVPCIEAAAAIAILDLLMGEC